MLRSMDAIILFSGAGLVIYAIVNFLRIWRRVSNSVFLPFKAGQQSFEIEVPGYYSISVLGAGHIKNLGEMSVRIEHHKKTLQVNQNFICPRFRENTQVGIECWGFTAEESGSFNIILENLNAIEPKSSLLFSIRMFQAPLTPGELKIIIRRSFTPFFFMVSILSLGIGLLILSTLAG